PTLIVTDTDKPSHRKVVGVTIHPAGHASAALHLDDILRAPESRRETLLWRLVGNTALRAGLALGSSQTRLPPSSSVDRRDVAFSTSDGRHVAIAIGDETRTIDVRAPNEDDALFALRAFDRTLLKGGAIDVDVARFYLPLFGPDGAFVRAGARGLDEK